MKNQRLGVREFACVIEGENGSIPNFCRSTSTPGTRMYVRDVSFLAPVGPLPDRRSTVDPMPYAS